MNVKKYNGLLAFHPGYYISEIIEDMEMTQDEFARRLGTTAKTLSNIVNGKVNISDDIANKLSMMLNTSVDLWLNLQKEYDKKVLEMKNEEEFDRQKSVLQDIDYSYFVKNNLLENTNSLNEKIKRLCAFLSVSNLNVLYELDLSANFRSSTKSQKDKNILNNNIWLEIAVKIAREKNVKRYDELKLKSYLPEIRGMTVKTPDEFVPRLEEIFSECGVAFVLLPKMKNAAINGAVKWLSPSKAVIAMNDRRNYADTFWFSLFHEIKHVIQHKVTYVMVTGANTINDINTTLEKEADEFARNYLITKADYSNFIKKKDFSEKAIIDFSREIEIDPGIIVGRLQKDGLLNYRSMLNKLKTKYEIC